MIICLEGINGAGKTTLATAIADRWHAAEGRAAAMAEPVQRTEFGRRVRTAIMSTADLDADAEALAFASARLHAASLLRGPEADLTILERWAGGVVAYGTVAGTSSVLLHALETVLAAALPIDRTLLVDVPGAVAARRLATQADANRFETNGAGYLEQVRREYLGWARTRQVSVISGTDSRERLDAWARDLVDGLRSRTCLSIDGVRCTIPGGSR